VITLDESVRLAQLALAFGRVNRVTRHEDGVTLESDSTHTVMLSLLACSVASAHNARQYEAGHLPPPASDALFFDVGRVAQLALVHDLPEALCGDTNTFGISLEALEAKRAREDAAFDQIMVAHIEHNEWFCDAMLEYQQMDSMEAQLVHYLDKLCPRLTHALNAGAVISDWGVSADALEEKCLAQDRRLRKEHPLIVPIVKQLYLQATELGVREMRAREAGE